MMTRVRFAAAGILCFVLVLVGCNSSNPNAPSSVQGKVTYNGSPVGGGFVHFHFEDGNKMSVPIGNDGTYSTDIMDGTFAVTVDTESVNPAKKQEYLGGGATGAGKQYGKANAAPKKAKGKGAEASPMPSTGASGEFSYVKIPAKYNKQETSGLSVTLKRGKNVYDIPLTD
jgi:hypothetical protein